METLVIDEAVSDLRTVGDFIRWGVSRFNETEAFYGHGTETSWDEAVFLIQHVLNLTPDCGLEIFNTRLTTSERRAVAGILMRRAQELIPAPYLTQEAWFGNLSFYVDERVIVPRSPIAELIEQSFEPWLVNAPARILDLCTGSGCIAVACAYTFPEAKVDAVDLSQDALAVAQINVESYSLEEHVRLMESNLFSALPGEQYDLIVSNPPYVGRDSYTQLPKEFHHEPEMSLIADEDGLALAIQIINQAASHLTEQGILVVEVGESQAVLEARFPAVPFTWIEFENGGEGVFVLTKAELLKYFPQQETQ